MSKKTVTTEDVALDVLRPKVPKKDAATGTLVKKKRVIKDKSLRATFREKLSAIEIERLKKPWMAKKSFRLITTDQGLADYVDGILNDPSSWLQPYASKDETLPVIAVDTETHGLDTRVIVGFEVTEETDPLTGGSLVVPVYELNIEIAGICLSSDGQCGVYLPLLHEDGQNVSFEAAHHHLQRLFDRSHLVFYNAKFDREVMRQTLGIVFRPYPYYEDVQVLKFINDPKVKLDDDTFTGGGQGLKGLSKSELGMEQIDLEEIGKVKAELEKTPEQIEAVRVFPAWEKLKKSEGPLACTSCGGIALNRRTRLVVAQDAPEFSEVCYECSACDSKGKFTKPKSSMRVQYVPFTWVPTPIALWYAAADAICTWLLWERFREEAQRRKTVHKIDGELIDSLSWVERQRFLIDAEQHERLVNWAERTKLEYRERLRQIAIRDGWREDTDGEGRVIADTIFNVDSTAVHLPRLLFQIKEFTPTKFTERGKPSCDADTLIDLRKAHPHDEFLIALEEYKEYVALHPENLSYDKRDRSARIYLKQATVSGGRLAASGGKFDRDGGFGMNIQAIKKVGGNWWVKGDVLVPDLIPEADVEQREERDLHDSCFKDIDKDAVVRADGTVLTPTDEAYAETALKLGYQQRNGKWVKKASGIIKNHIANYLGYSICLVPDCRSCAEKHGVLAPKGKIDANQIINLRCLFVAEDGWTFFSSDYSNIEMRVAANNSQEPSFIREFLEGSGDFHTLTASNVFPEFNDPKTSKARRKELRNLAKIINFALLYGGTEYTIYESMKKVNPDITKEDTRGMVEAYWRGVPKFREWCDGMQKIAREEMTCTTPMGRIVKFRSDMEAQGIMEPDKEQWNNYWTYMRLRKRQREVEAKYKESGSEEDKAEAAMLKGEMDALWQDRDSGVRNAIDYQKFLSKIQRVSVNIPLQGLAGDLMRICLNRVYKWAAREQPLVQSVFRLHGSVHDEIDYAVKNEYVPFVIPRVTRLMKLRKLHAKRNWTVPIECDTEYGRSWDVSFHMTGDDGHKPSGWTDIKGMEEYLPAEFDLTTVEKVLKAFASPKEEARQKAHDFLKGCLHTRAYPVVKSIQEAKTPQDARKYLFAALHLHEYWTIDEVPDGEDAKLESFEQFERRCGLSPASRGFMPPDGWLFSVPCDKAKRKPVPFLGPEPEPDSGSSGPSLGEQPPVVGFEDYDEPVKELQGELFREPELEPVAAATPEPESACKPAPVVPVEETEDDMFHPAPKKRVAPVVPEPEPAPVTVAEPEPKTPALDPEVKVYQLRPDLTDPELTRLCKRIGYGQGDQKVAIRFDGKTWVLDSVRFSVVPFEYCVREEAAHA